MQEAGEPYRLIVPSDVPKTVRANLRLELIVYRFQSPDTEGTKEGSKN